MEAIQPQIRRIKRLPETLINQIAAGEVVDRPASVVKELVENSLDSLATRLEIHLSEGGLREILVIDNGHGISKDDLPLCVERHTTSKIESDADLERIQTFGFRGEALSSIASVSSLTVKSRPAIEAQGWRLEVDFGIADETVAPVGMASGTQISVKSLFERVPARLKFLKSVNTELSHCTRLVKELALGHPEAQFQVFHNGKLIAQYTAASRVSRFQECLRINWDPLVCEDSQDGFECEAFLSPAHLIQSRGDIFFYLNGRLIKNRTLLSAVRNAYLETLGPNHEPTAAVFLNIRTDWVDVNVHPQKTEVRVLRQESLYPWLSALVRKTVSQNPGAREVVVSKLSENTSPSYQWAARSAEISRPTPITTQPSSPRAVELPTFVPSATIQASSPLRFLGQVKATYLICEDPDGIYLVDQHALHEKIRYEELCKKMECREGIIGIGNVYEVVWNAPPHVGSRF